MAEPLWRVMQRADSTAASDYQSPEARMIRAIADWLVPEEIEPERAFEEEGYVPGRLREERQRLRQKLLAEADRAERGEE